MKIKRDGQPTIDMNKVEAMDKIDDPGPPPEYKIIFHIGGREYYWTFDDVALRDGIYDRIQNMWGCVDFN